MHQPEALIQGQIDIGFTRSMPAQYRQQLRSEVPFSEPLMAALPKGHALANEPVIHVAQLAADRFVLYSREGSPQSYLTRS